jgi:hypothetical protein
MLSSSMLLLNLILLIVVTFSTPTPVYNNNNAAILVSCPRFRPLTLVTGVIAGDLTILQRDSKP